MKKIFWDNPYQTSLETQVIQVNGNTVILDATIGFAESGGQESDRVTINDIEVLSSHMDKSSPFLIYYTLREGHGLIPGEKVIMRIDWQRRNCLMRLHFTCELVLVLMNRLFNKTPEGVELKPEEIDTVIKKEGLISLKSGHV